MGHGLNINKLRQMEKDLEGDTISMRGPSLERDAKVNLLKFLQVRTVEEYELAYDNLYYELNMRPGRECLRRVQDLDPKSDLLQPKILEAQGCDADENLENQLEFYSQDATCAKVHLDKLVQEVADGHQGCNGVYPEVKSRESTKRKATKFCGGDVRKVIDMARVSVICATPEDLELAFKRLVESIEVRSPEQTEYCHRALRKLQIGCSYFGKLLYVHARRTLHPKSLVYTQQLPFRDTRGSWAAAQKSQVQLEDQRVFGYLDFPITSKAGQKIMK